ncbi:hypothetical protein EB796_014107 [Bugula neritina]|uniref:Uncharacterized protein n=1 Tax=Bugula neritina TaxID=10212 RepID=A0A7J7JQ79_BUGNE|nr:hypothetical protein EB796_014107 [Bugula neritina]
MLPTLDSVSPTDGESGSTSVLGSSTISTLSLLAGSASCWATVSCALTASVSPSPGVTGAERGATGVGVIRSTTTELLVISTVVSCRALTSTEDFVSPSAAHSGT